MVIEIHVSKHPSGGYLANVSKKAPEGVHTLMYDFSVWVNSPSVNNCKEYEFSKSPFSNDFEKFKTWIETTLKLKFCYADVTFIEI